MLRAYPYFLFHICIALLLALICPVLFPKLQILFFIPLLAWSLFRHSFSQNLFLALFLGLITDLLTISHDLGFHIFFYILSLTLTRPFKHYFFEDAFSTLPLLATLISAIYTFLLLVNFVGMKGLSLSIFMSECCVMPLLDGLFTLCMATLPIFIWGKRTRYQAHTYQQRPQ